MDYEPLTTLFYKDNSAQRFAQNQALAEQRLNSPTTFRTGVVLDGCELFCATPHELLNAMERTLRLERKVSKALDRLPVIARGALVRSLVIDEVVSSNELEGIGSTRRQIDEALRAEGDREEQDAPHRRFREFAKCYLELSDENHVVPAEPAGIRSVYDRIMDGEDLGKSAPDGRWFRRGGVDVVSSSQKVLHQGVEPEEAIVEKLGQMLNLVNSEEVPQTLSAVLSHYIFEAIHPFYDGNGRTGRYLLALYLSEPFSVLTSLSLSRTIAEDKNPYYWAFKDVQSPQNHGELTFFVLTMLDYIAAAQRRLLNDLSKKQERLSCAQSAVDRLVEDGTLGAATETLLRAFVQWELFGVSHELSRDDCAEILGLKGQMTRKHLKALEERGLVEVTSSRPLRFALTREAARTMGLVE